MNKGYLTNQNKFECVGCKACQQICPKNAISFFTDKEGFFYPQVNKDLCINCGLCHKVCLKENDILFNKNIFVYGGYNKNVEIKKDSTSGGVFSLLAEKCLSEGYVVFGAASEQLNVYHTFVETQDELHKFRKSKYTQSDIGTSYRNVKEFLLNNKKVLFSGTPCQIEGLKLFLSLTPSINTDFLTTIEVVCQGLPSPLYIHKYQEYLEKKYKARLIDIVYRNKTSRNSNRMKWDFEVEKITLDKNGRTIVKYKDRWVNPFWPIWIKNLMSRPSCYECDFTRKERVADITLGDLWGVHLYCPELYGKNGGSSLILCNTEKGSALFNSVKKDVFGHELKLEDAVKYQGPLREHITMNSRRDEFFNDLHSDMTYKDINKKWSDKMSFKLFFQKYIWGNRQKMFIYRLKRRITRKN